MVFSVGIKLSDSRNETTDVSVEITNSESWIAIAYLAAYLAYLFATLESDFVHWLTMVLLPLPIVIVFGPIGRRSFRGALASCGLKRGNLKRGLSWALAIGALISLAQLLISNRRDAILDVITSGRIFVFYPMVFLLLLLTAGFTEEFFFRGFLQTRLERIVRSKWLAVVAAAILFGIYHFPYAYLNPHWPSAGDWGAAWVAALGNGVPAGIVLGSLYVKSKHNLLPCILLHSMTNAFPAMTMIRFGGG